MKFKSNIPRLSAGWSRTKAKFLAPLLLILLSFLLLGVIIGTAQISFGLNSKSGWGSRLNASAMLSILSVMQALSTAVTGLAISSVFERLQWKFMARAVGLDVLGMLGLSPTTSLWGALRIGLHRRAVMSSRLWAMIRLLLMGTVFVAGILLLLQTDIQVDYHSRFRYKVTAGAGHFNGSQVLPYIRKLQSYDPGTTSKVMPYHTQALVYNLVANPIYSISQPPIACVGQGCSSYLMTGGLMMTTPWQPAILSDVPFVKLEKVIGRQIEFQRGFASGDALKEEDCTVYSDGGRTTIAMKVCIASSQVSHNAVLAGFFMCPNTPTDNSCKTTSAVPNVTATMTVYNRLSTVIADRNNYRVVSALDLSKPQQDPTLDLVGYKQVIDWLLDFDAAGIPAISSIAELFWTSQTQLQSKYWDPELAVAFHSILAFPMWLFNSNNFGNPNLMATTISPDLPAEFYTDASIVEPYTRIILNTAMFVMFLVGQGVALLFALIVSVWLGATREFPTLSSFPLADFAMKTRYDFRLKSIVQGGPTAHKAADAGDGSVMNQLSRCPPVTWDRNRVLSDTYSQPTSTQPAMGRSSVSTSLISQSSSSYTSLSQATSTRGSIHGPRYSAIRTGPDRTHTV